MNELKCPLCKTDSYINPDIKIFISPCYHKICESCLNRIFSLGQAPCPECNISLRKINYISQTFEDVDVEKECKLRKLLQKVYYLKKHDFENDIMLYNDYLEDFEDKIFQMLECSKPSTTSKIEDNAKIGDIKNTVDEIIEEIKIKYGELSKMNHEHDRMQSGILKRKNDADSSNKLDKKSHESNVFSQKIKVRKTKDVEEVFDPLKDVEILPVRISKKHKIPNVYEVNYLPGGFSENLLIFKAVNSIYDIDI